MLSSFYVYSLLVLIGLTGGIGDIFLYKWAGSRQVGWLLGAYLFWWCCLTSLGVLFRLEYFTFGAAIILATVIHLFISLLWALLFTEGTLNRIEMVGIVFGVIAIVLLEIGRNRQ